MPEQASTHKKKGCGVPIMTMIMVATLFSTASSMAGGLVLYFQGLSSLEASVRETSEGEVASLRDSIVAVLDKTSEFTGAMQKITFSLEKIKTNNSEEWANITRAAWYSLVSSSPILYSCGMSMVSFDKHDGSVFYSVVWGDPRKDGSQEYMHGHYAPYMNQTEYFPRDEKTGEVLFMWVRAWTLYGLGYLGDFLYMWDGVWSFLDTLQEWDPRQNPSIPDDYTSDLYDWDEDRRAPGAVGSRWWRPGKWYSSDLLYTFTELESIYIPPPAPHPWSRYRAIAFQVGFLYSSWVAPFVEYKRSRPDTTALIVDRVTTIVYVSTTGDNMIPERCQTVGSNVDVDLECASRVENLPEYLQQAYVKFNAEPFDVFTKLTLDGEEYFARKTHIFRQAELFWLRPVSSIEGEVNKALVLLIIFTSVVLVFDIMISVVEVVFIALPLKRSSQAIQALGNLDTAVAASAVEEYATKCFMVSEVKSLIHGLSLSIDRLQELRTFMPESVLAEQHSAEEDTEGCTSASRTNKSGGSVTSDSQSKSMGSHLHKTHQADLTLCLQSRPIGVLRANIVGWSQTFSGCNDKELLSQHGQVLSTVLDCTQGGVLDSFTGDRFLVGWNTVKQKASYYAKPLESAIKIKESIRGFTMSFGAACGKAKVGNMGTKTMRRFTVLSDCLPWVSQLEAFNKTRKLTCTTEVKLMERCKGFTYTIVDAVVHPKSGNPVILCNVTGMPTSTNEEWMYALEQTETSAEAQMNEFMVAIMNGDFEKKLSADLEAKVPEMFRTAQRTKTFTPLLMGFSRT